jgi:hypothetical protein
MGLPGRERLIHPCFGRYFRAVLLWCRRWRGISQFAGTTELARSETLMASFEPVDAAPAGTTATPMAKTGIVSAATTCLVRMVAPRGDEPARCRLGRHDTATDGWLFGVPEVRIDTGRRTELSFEVSGIVSEVNLQQRGVAFAGYDHPGLRTAVHVCVLGSEQVNDAVAA